MLVAALILYQHVDCAITTTTDCIIIQMHYHDDKYQQSGNGKIYRKRYNITSRQNIAVEI